MSRDSRPILDTAQERFLALLAAPGMSLRKLARRAPYTGIPLGTLARFAETGHLPARYRSQLGLPPLVTVPGRYCANGCGTAFVPRSRNHRFCSRRCQYTAWRKGQSNGQVR